MRGLFIFLLLCLAIGGLVGWLLTQDSGYVMVAYKTWTLETTLAIGAILAGLVFLALYFLFRVILNLLAPGGLVGRWLGGQRRKVTEIQTRLGMQAYLEGEWDKAVRLLTKSADNSPTTQLNYLLAAKASHNKGEEEESQALLEQARKSQGKAKIAIALAKAEMQFSNGEYQKSLETLQNLKKRAAKHPKTINLMVKLHEQFEDWPAVIELLPDVNAQKYLSVAEFSQLQRKAYSNHLTAAAKGGHKSLQQAWAKVPSELKHDASIIRQHVLALKTCGANAEAEKVLRDFLSNDWDDSLVLLYGDLDYDKPQEQMTQAKNWLKSRPDNPALTFCLGRLALQQGNLDEAQVHLEASYQTQPTAQAAHALALLFSTKGDHKTSNDYHKACYKHADMFLPVLA